MPTSEGYAIDGFKTVTCKNTAGTSSRALAGGQKLSGRSIEKNCFKCYSGFRTSLGRRGEGWRLKHKIDHRKKLSTDFSLASRRDLQEATGSGRRQSVCCQQPLVSRPKQMARHRHVPKKVGVPEVVDTTTTRPQYGGMIVQSCGNESGGVNNEVTNPNRHFNIEDRMEYIS
eukprot:jgi/Psemu1/9854/gm1.9854_g